MFAAGFFSCSTAAVSIAAYLAVTGPPPDAPPPDDPLRPNIIFILADDLGWGDVGFQGQLAIRTPNIDRLASEGRRFGQFYSGATVCAPSRAVLMTGRHAGRVSVRGNVSPEATLDPEETTIAEVFKQAGYRTALVGKWGLGGASPLPDYGGTGELIPDRMHSLPTRRGFDSFLGYLDQVSAHDYYPQALWHDEELVPLEGNHGVPRGERTTYSHDVMTAEVIRIIGEADGETPLFLQYSALIPHRETIAPPGVNPYGEEPWPEVERSFAAMITYFDGEVGLILSAIEANEEIRENTLVILSSDNGPQSTDGHSPEFFKSSGPFRGAKRDLYEGGIRVPFVAWWPGRIEAGTNSGMPADFVDLMPTFAELAGVEAPEGIDGRSLAGPMLGTGGAVEREFFLWAFMETNAGPGEEPAQMAVRRGKWKLVVKLDGGRELYDLEADLSERWNLGEWFPEVVQELEGVLREEIDPPWPGSVLEHSN
jgi:arylsulfatase A-like enzyme